MTIPYGAVYFRKSNPPKDDWERDYQTAAQDGLNIFRHWFMQGSICIQGLSMRVFFLKLTVLCLPFAVYLFPRIFIPLPEYSYISTAIYKNNLLQNAKSPKLVLAGGSNVGLGIDSEVVEAVFNIPVVNTGINAGFGLGRMLDNISPFLNAGDILLIVPEYHHFTNGWNGGIAAYELIFGKHQYHLFIHPGYYNFPAEFKDYVVTRRYDLKTLLWPLSGPDANSYWLDNYNNKGDFIKHLEEENIEFLNDPKWETFGNLNNHYIQSFFRFVDDLASRGIKLALSYPSCEAVAFLRNIETIRMLDVRFRAKENLLTISKPEDYSFPQSLCYDMIYHLNREGRKLRTERLITDIERSGIVNDAVD